MIKALIPIALSLPAVFAWPAALEVDQALKRAASTGRPQTGALHPDPPFDAASQYVNVAAGSGHEFIAPGEGDMRGQCPGLNAAANHGFLPRNGKPHLLDAIEGLGAAYNMSPELAGFLAAAAILLGGDIPSQTWSIGPGFKSSVPGILADPKGLYGLHNKYEADASIVRGDAFLNNGYVDVFQMRSWENIMSIIESNDDNFSLDGAANQSNFVTTYSLNNNPHYFSGPFSGIVAPGAQNFVATLMSNHSAEFPGGRTTKEVIKSFFAVTGDKTGEYVHNRGQERIPDRWFKRPGGAFMYTAPDVVADVLAGAAIYPKTLRFGGNTGTTNSFTGVDLNNFTGGAFNAGTLFQGNNLACFAYTAATAGQIDQLDTIEQLFGGVLKELTGSVSEAFAGLGCPSVEKYNYNALQIFPGFDDSDSS